MDNWTIWSSPRTGSTSLNHWLRHYLKLTVRPWNEPHWNGRWAEFMASRQQGEGYMVKLHALDLGRYPLDLQKEFLDNRAVRIRRRSRVDQLASYYVAQERGFWGGFVYYKDRATPWDREHDVEIRPSLLAERARELERYNQCLDQMTLDWQQDLWYEDLVFPETCQFRPSPRPRNYQELRELASRVIEAGHAE